MALDENKKTEFIKELNEAREDKDYAWVVEIAAEIADAGDNDWAKIILKETEVLSSVCLSSSFEEDEIFDSD